VCGFFVVRQWVSAGTLTAELSLCGILGVSEPLLTNIYDRSCQ